jgi:hypothetical protein
VPVVAMFPERRPMPSASVRSSTASPTPFKRNINSGKPNKISRIR